MRASLVKLPHIHNKFKTILGSCELGFSNEDSKVEAATILEPMNKGGVSYGEVGVQASSNKH